jgi:hypothetical protein
MRTERADFTFTVKEYSDGTPWIAAEQLRGDMPTLKGLVGFDLRPDTTYGEAMDMAKYLRQHLAGLNLLIA